MDRITELERYRVLAAVHVWDLEYGGRKRDWPKIRQLAEVKQPVRVIKKAFFRLRKPTDLWFPYPVLGDKDLLGSQLSEETGGGNGKPWGQVLQEVLLAANVVEPWAMYTEDVRLFLGLQVDSYNAALEQVKNHLVGAKRQQYLISNSMVDVKIQDDFFIRREMVNNYITVRRW